MKRKIKKSRQEVSTGPNRVNRGCTPAKNEYKTTTKRHIINIM